MRFVLPSILIFLLLASCSTFQICDDNNESLMVVRLKTIDEGETRDTIVEGLSVWGYRGWEHLEKLYESASASRLVLPLDPSAGESRFILKNELSSDTLVVVHDSEAYLISNECGFAMRFLIQEAECAFSWINDVELIQEDIDAETETYEEHIRIYF